MRVFIKHFKMKGDGQMALTEQQKKELQEVLDRTGAPRAADQAAKIFPEDYVKNEALVERKEIMVEVSSVNVPVKCYITTAKDKAENCPVHVNMHGGGFVFPQNEDDDRYCAHIAAAIRGIVVDIDYATSFDHAYPVAFEQCYEVVRWVYENCQSWGGNPENVSMGGHSAGGCLVAAIALKAAKTKDFKVSLQILDYAANDNFAPFLDENPQSERSRAFSMLYADGDIELLKHPYVSPVYAPLDMLKDQPRTLIINAKNCPFCGVNEEYGKRLVEMGTEVKMKRFLNSRHGFTARVMDEWREAQELIIREILDAGNGDR